MSSPEVRGMQDILDKLNAAAETHHNSTQVNESTEATTPVVHTANVSKNAKGMYDILAKLEAATKTAATEVALEAEHDTSLITAGAVRNRVTDSIDVDGNYKIQLVEKNVIEGVKKKFYNIEDSTGTVLHKELALFESAMGIVKNLMFDKGEHKIEKIVQLDDRYASNLQEAAMYKHKSMTLTESYKTDVYVAKQGNAMHKLQSIKKQIKSLL
jgi:uncharacterized protein with GYD domain|tara:strand:+ start:2268 stop:2906 length:639 start_codon:yes stop_codon:yes gene_type:complete